MYVYWRGEGRAVQGGGGGVFVGEKEFEKKDEVGIKSHPLGWDPLF